MPVIPSLNLTITPTYALYTQRVPDPQITVNESLVEGRHAIILDFNNTEGLYVRDLGTIFSWPTNEIPGTILDVWQPTIAPMDGEIYDRLSYHCLMTSLGAQGWQHVREMNIAHASTSDITLLLNFDTGASPVSLSVIVPNSGGPETKTKVTMPPNKFKLVEIFLSSAKPFKCWTNDLEMKIKTWGSAEAYRVARPVSG